MLLGTGTPMPRMGRFGASILVEAVPEKPDQVVACPTGG